MPSLIDDPRLIFLASFVSLSIAVWWGGAILSQSSLRPRGTDNNFNVIQNASLTLLALIIGFSFAMAIERYDARKNLEEGEANAISTELLRSELLSAPQSSNIKILLKQYTDLRVAFYTERNTTQLVKITQATTELQRKLWQEVIAGSHTSPNPIVALAVSGMNDVINSQGYTQAAWWNRIPPSAWMLLFGIAFCACVVTGLGANNFKENWQLFLIIPFVVSLSFFLIADIDSPRNGIILVTPQNLLTLFN